MSKKLESVMYEHRAILSIWNEPDGSDAYTIGTNGVKSIVAYSEYGEMSQVPWFEVSFDDGESVRLNGKQVAGLRLSKATNTDDEPF